MVDPKSRLPHTLPSPGIFAEHAGLLGLSEADRIVVYDGPGMFTAPRVWWMLRTMGARDVKVLDGGFDNWKAEGRPVTAEATGTRRATFTPDFDAAAVATLGDMRSIIEDGGTQIADARSAGRFSGDEPEPRAGMRSGHMPGARNVPTFSLSENGRLKSLPELREVFAKARRGSRQAGRDHMRLRCHGSRHHARAAVAVARAEQALRRLLVRVGRPARHAGRSGPGKARGDRVTKPSRPQPLKTTVTYLEMTALPQVHFPLPMNIQAAVMRARNIPLHFYRYLQYRTGRPWHWVYRLRLDDATLCATSSIAIGRS